jgi:hypothetical protein
MQDRSFGPLETIPSGDSEAGSSRPQTPHTSEHGGASLHSSPEVGPYLPACLRPPCSCVCLACAVGTCGMPGSKRCICVCEQGPSREDGN